MSAAASRPLDAADRALVASARTFRGLAPEVVAALCQQARVVTAKKGQALFHEGDPAQAVYLVLTGRAKLLETSAEGVAVVLRLEGPGTLLGLHAALGGARYPVSALALETTTAARWSGHELHELMEAAPRIALAILPEVLARLLQVQDQYRELATERVERRIARVVARLVRQAGQRTPEGVLVNAALTRQELAEMAGTTLFTVSRVLSQWTADGFLQTRGRKLLLTQPHALARIAEDFPLPDEPG